MDKKKRLKRIEGLERAKKEHQEKIKHYEGKNKHPIPYWEGEIERIDSAIREEKRKIEDG